ncbi:MAG: 1,2-phenylacetyl-CoA epoxidase subunit PaaD [Cyclobacteriaceae bacterium]
MTEQDVYTLLKDVMDPEIPVLSLVDLGVITGVEVVSDGKVKVEMTPTFVGCPAMDYMKQEVEDKLKSSGIPEPEVNITFREHWSSDKITPEGRKKLKEFGLAPPPVSGGANLIEDLDILEKVECPNCGSENTLMKTPFGPTLCRSIHHCSDCKETFEQFKPL